MECCPAEVTKLLEQKTHQSMLLFIYVCYNIAHIYAAAAKVK